MKGRPANRGKVVSEAEFRRLWADDGLSLEDIGARLGITGDAVAMRGRTRKLPPRTFKRKTRLAKMIGVAEFSRLWLAGVRQIDIAKRLRISDNTVRKEARRLGLPARGGKRGRAATLAEYLMRQDAIEVRRRHHAEALEAARLAA